jgi:hypothetical protein
VKTPKGRKIVGSRWVFDVKANELGELERYKARFVAQGFSQQPGIDFDEIFSPTVRFDSLRLLLAISACRGWKPRQLDIKTAFLYGVLKEEIYMQLPEGSKEEGMVAKLKRCIYGLKQSSREWYFRLVNFLQPYGFSSTTFDPCVLVHNSGDLFIAIYVDDLSLFGQSGSLFDTTIQLLKTEFNVKDMGDLHWLLGIRIEYTDAGISLSQTAFIDKILNRFNMVKCNPSPTPIDHNQRFHKSTDGDKRANAKHYQQLIGSLMYLVTATRFDLAFTITFLSQYNSDPNILHQKAANRVLKYLQHSKDKHLLYTWNKSIALQTFCDASHGNCHDTRRSFSGYLLKLGECPISWRSRKQKSVATSTCEAEYMALTMACKHHIWITRGLKELLGKDIPSILLTDNNGAIDISKNSKINDSSKHIEIAYHFTREKVQEGTVKLLHCPGKDNLADICTKGLARPIFDQLCTLIRNTN